MRHAHATNTGSSITLLAVAMAYHARNGSRINGVKIMRDEMATAMVRRSMFEAETCLESAFWKRPAELRLFRSALRAASSFPATSVLRAEDDSDANA